MDHGFECPDLLHAKNNAVHGPAEVGPVVQAAGAGSGPHPPDAEHVPGEYARKARASRIREQPGTPLEADALVNSKEPDSQVEATPVVASEPPVSSALSGEVGAEIESDNAPLGVVVEAVPQNPVEVEAKDIVSEEVSPEEQENSGDVEDAVSETSTLQPHQPDTPKGRGRVCSCSRGYWCIVGTPVPRD